MDHQIKGKTLNLKKTIVHMDFTTACACGVYTTCPLRAIAIAPPALILSSA